MEDLSRSSNKDDSSLEKYGSQTKGKVVHEEDEEFKRHIKGICKKGIQNRLSTHAVQKN
jgi:hypothetical protein